MRLQQFLARAGIASRRKSEDLIREGRVSINGQLAQIGAVVSEGDSVRFDGERVRLPEKRVVIALNKPLGIVTTKSDPHAPQTVYQLVPDIPGLHPVGRLDKDSEGLLLLTNDGHLTERLTHPRYGIQKIYRVWCKKGEISFVACRRLVEGVPLDNYLAKAIEAKPMNGGARVTMSEGKKREVKRMLSAVGFPVERLLRTQVGPIVLGDLQPGQWRYLSAEEIAGLEQFINPEVAKATRQAPKPRVFKTKPEAIRPAAKPDLSPRSRTTVKPDLGARPKPKAKPRFTPPEIPQELLPEPKRKPPGSRPSQPQASSRPNRSGKTKPKPATAPPEIPQELLRKPKHKSPSPNPKRTNSSGPSATSDRSKPQSENRPKPRFDLRKKPRSKRG